MKRILTMALVLMLILSLFAGCGGTNTPAVSSAPAEETKAPVESSSPAESADPVQSEEPESPYHFAKGKFKADENGIALEKYDYELPLTTTDEEISYWMTCYVPQYLPEGGIRECPLQEEVENRTGVHANYVVISPQSLRENFSVLMASDDLCDITCGARSYYTGTFRDAVTTEGYFINVYDYRDYTPNFLYETTKDPEDVDTIRTVFTEKDLILNFYLLRSDLAISDAPFCRGDWLKKIGMSNTSIKTFDDFTNMFRAFQSEIGCEHPMTLFSSLEVGGCNSFIGYDTYCTVGSISPIVKDGSIVIANTTDNDLALMTMLNQWFNEGIMDPNWASYSSIQDIDPLIDDGTLGFIVNGGITMGVHDGRLPEGTEPWAPLYKPTRYEDQTLHLGFTTPRIGWASAAISAKCENIELACTWLDWRYSNEGSFLYGYGVQGFTWDYDENGEIYILDSIVNHEAYYGMIMTIHSLNHLCDPGLQIDYSLKMAINKNVPDNLKFWLSRPHDNAYVIPSTITYTQEQLDTFAEYRTDISTYISEHYLAFVDGSAPLSEWDSYVADLENMGLQIVIDTYQEAYDSYLTT